MTTFVSPELESKDSDNATRSGGTPTFFDTLKKNLNKPPALKAFDYIKVPGQPFALKINADLSAERLESLQKRYANKKTGKLDRVSFYCALIATQTEVFVTPDSEHEPAVDGYGDVVNFYHGDVRDAVGAMDAAAAVKELFARDSNILKAGDEILEITGYAGGDDEDDDESDPLDSEND